MSNCKTKENQLIVLRLRTIHDKQHVFLEVFSQTTVLSTKISFGHFSYPVSHKVTLG